MTSRAGVPSLATLDVPVNGHACNDECTLVDRSDPTQGSPERYVTPDPSLQRSPINSHVCTATLESSVSKTLPQDLRYLTFSTLADEDIAADRLLDMDYNELPTYPVRPSYKDNPAVGNIETHLVSFDPCKDDPYHPASMPIYQTATFQMPSIEKFGPYDYTRSGNPTRTALEQLVASLEGAHAAFAFNSGMAAMTAMTRLCEAGDEIVCGDDIYGGAFRLFTRISSAKQGIAVKFIDTTDLKNIEAAMTPKTKIVYIESPSNPCMRITDLRKTAELAHQHKALLVVDSTMMSPYLMNPLRLGADVVIHSGTKFLAGHSDTMAGFVCCLSEELAREIAFVQNAEGTALAPFDSWLTLRGLKTLAIRQEAAQKNALLVAKFLASHPCVTAVHYAGLARDLHDKSSKGLHPTAYALHMAQTRGGGSVLSFETGNLALSRKICDAVKMFKITVSFGSCNSLIEMPCVLSHASIPKEMRGLPDDLIRLSIGIEHIDDLLADLAQAMKRALSLYQSQTNIDRQHQLKKQKQLQQQQQQQQQQQPSSPDMIH